nr:hypothetical protein [Actinomyces sp.]
MRPGPPTAALAGGLAVGVRVDVLRAGRVLAADVPAAKVALEWSAGRAVPARLTYEVPEDWVPRHPLDPLNRFGQRSAVSVVCRSATGRVWETPLGEYLHTDWDSSGGTVTVTAMDLMQVLEDDPMPWPSSPGRGARVRSELQRLAGSLPVVLDPGVADSPVAVTTQWGNSRTEAVWKLADSKGFGLRCGADGCLHAYPLRDAAVLDVVYEAASLGGGRVGNGLLVDAPAAPGGESRRPNRWVVTGTSSEGGQDTRWSAERTATAPPFDVEGYGWVTSHKEFSAAGSREAVEKAADSYMRSDLYAVTTRSVEVVPDPRLEVGDVVGVVTADEVLAGRVVAYSLPVSEVGASMRVDLALLEW